MDQDQLYAMRHSTAHILATAVTKMWPTVRLGVGPVIDNGFYYDVDIPGIMITESDLTRIEKEMSKIIAQNQPFVQTQMSIEAAKQWALDGGQIYKTELLNDLSRDGITAAKDIDGSIIGNATDASSVVESVGFYTNGEFTDLCRGPHVDSTGKVGAFKLQKLAGAYWRGKETNPQMQRIYGIAFATKEDLDTHLEMLEEAKKRDHRKIGKDLDLFTFSNVIGSGLPMLTENGSTVRRILERFIVDEEISRGYKHVTTPDMANIELYEKSGHYPYYKDSMYSPISIDDEQFMLRPMTCPHHFELFLRKPHSYKDMPVRLAELAKLYRYEKSGELSGLMRVRSFTLADSHIVCRPDQVKDEISGALDLIDYCASSFGLVKGEDYRYRLSLGDRSDESKYYKDDVAWEEGEGMLRQLLISRDEPYYEASGEAAFYGPKIDIQMKNVSGKEDTAFTVQYDFVMPKRFNLKYIDDEGKDVNALVVHRSSIGAIERVMAFLIERYSGWFPFWLAPEQIRILTINDSVTEYVDEIKSILDSTVLMKPLKYNELRYTIDDRSESLGKKIREATMMKIPVLLIVGPKDRDSSSVSVRTRDSETNMSISELKDFLMNAK
jgi:threonyl-tRNA synthetase